ncbi:hypothetical protein MBH78_04725 [Oceanimonas sp. NS1]|nr:hypothetical protein [Oceanimonas sp. NS1]
MVFPKLSVIAIFGLLYSLHSAALGASSFDHERFDATTLAQNPYWLKLGHYLSKPLRGSVSTIRQGRFFLRKMESKILTPNWLPPWNTCIAEIRSWPSALNANIRHAIPGWSPCTGAQRGSIARNWNDGGACWIPKA